MNVKTTPRVPLEDRMPAIREKLREIRESLDSLTMEEKEGYYTFLHSLNMTISYSYMERRK